MTTEQLALTLDSMDWGTIAHERLEEWIQCLPSQTRVSMKETDIAKKYMVSYYDQHKKERLGLIFILFDFNAVHMIQYSGGVPFINKKKVFEEDLYHAEKWLRNIVNESSPT